jgi:putative DNA primase/helicase
MTAVISGDTISADFKFQQVFQFDPFCKLIFALNSMPQVNDKTDAFYRRLIIVRFPRQFEDSEQNKNLKYELTEQETDGIFLWMLEGLKRLEARGYFELPAGVKEEIASYRKENNNVLTFTEEECESGVNLITSKQELYDAYAAWCKQNGYKELSKRKFWAEIAKSFKKVSDGFNSIGDVRVWFGIGLLRPLNVQTGKIF